MKGHAFRGTQGTQQQEPGLSQGRAQTHRALSGLSWHLWKALPCRPRKMES